MTPRAPALDLQLAASDRYSPVMHVPRRPAVVR
jgi:hypothetical protein